MGLNLPFHGLLAKARLDYFFYAMLGLDTNAFITTWNVANNRLRFVLNCIRQTDDAANIAGIDTTRYKIIAFTISGAFAAAAGAIYASWTGYIEPSDVYDV